MAYKTINIYPALKGKAKDRCTVTIQPGEYYFVETVNDYGILEGWVYDTSQTRRRHWVFISLNHMIETENFWSGQIFDRGPERELMRGATNDIISGETT